MSKQTAIEYLIQEIKNDALVQAKSTEEWNEVFRIAKEMEREQIIDAYYEGKEYGFKEQGEQYYKETYGTNTTTTNKRQLL